MGEIRGELPRLPAGQPPLASTPCARTSSRCAGLRLLARGFRRSSCRMRDKFDVTAGQRQIVTPAGDVDQARRRRSRLTYQPPTAAALLQERQHPPGLKRTTAASARTVCVGPVEAGQDRGCRAFGGCQRPRRDAGQIRGDGVDGELSAVVTSPELNVSPVVVLGGPAAPVWAAASADDGRCRTDRTSVMQSAARPGDHDVARPRSVPSRRPHAPGSDHRSGHSTTERSSAVSSRARPSAASNGSPPVASERSALAQKVPPVWPRTTARTAQVSLDPAQPVMQLRHQSGRQGVAIVR